jgi:hypothetical protein
MCQNASKKQSSNQCEDLHNHWATFAYYLHQHFDIGLLYLENLKF